MPRGYLLQFFGLVLIGFRPVRSAELALHELGPFPGNFGWFWKAALVVGFVHPLLQRGAQFLRTRWCARSVDAARVVDLERIVLDVVEFLVGQTVGRRFELEVEPGEIVGDPLSAE